MSHLKLQENCFLETGIFFLGGGSVNRQLEKTLFGILRECKSIPFIYGNCVISPKK